MHGRLKIKSTAQQEAEKQAAQAKKLAAYQSASQEIMTRRDVHRHDVETLKLIAGILEKNPDVTVLWNYRREILASLRDSLKAEEVEELIENELEFDAICLKVNPKSYYTWHHRCWILLNAPKPNWDRELMLCGRFLSYDERNFHCWDYRRWLVQQAKVCPEKELDFVTTKLYDNFSNFSAWHYRSRLIPKVNAKADYTESNPVLPKEVLVEEYELVRNALYVDPKDQSPWFYHRWLLSKCTERKTVLHSAVFNQKTQSLFLAFSKPVSSQTVGEVLVCFGSKDDKNPAPLECSWSPVRCGNASSLWKAYLTEVTSVAAETAMIHVSDGSNTLKCSVGEHSLPVARTKTDPKTFFFSSIDSRVWSLIEFELESIRDLHSMENNSKWVLLELTALLRILEPIKSEKEVMSLVDTLIDVDRLRERYYRDLKSRFLIENRIIDCFQGGQSSFNLIGAEVTRFTSVDWLAGMTEIDLSDNQLQTLPDDCQYLICLVKLRIDRNKITSLQPLRQLPSLEVVSARENLLTQVQKVHPIFSAPAIQSVDIAGNAVASGEELTELNRLLQSLPTKLDVILR